MHPFLTIADRAARRAGLSIIKALDRLERLQVYEKKVNDFVTEIDREVEHSIIETIRKAYPDHAILAEESGMLPASDEYTWVIDPLDGTTNFIHGLPYFAISIGIQYRNRIEHALIYDPLRQETFTASRGCGAYLNSRQRLRVSTRAQLKGALVYTSHPPRDPVSLEYYLRALGPLLTEVAGVRHLGAAALGLAYVAASRLDGFWSAGLQAWDMAAGALLVQEAGGIVCDEKGGEDYLVSGTVVSANPKLCRYLVQAVHSASVVA